MQGTVASYEPDTRSGSVLLDDGVRLPFAAAALDGTRLRLLRPGQRVRLEVDGVGAERHVTALQILTLA
jgi:2-phospho-L-lactate guanylyltransferase